MVTLHVTDADLLAVWDQGCERSVWTKVRTKAAEADTDENAERLALAEGKLAGLPQPLVALAANRDLIRRLTGARWYVILLAREGGASWEQVGEALESTADEVVAAYTAAIESQERYVGAPLHDAARARAVLAPAPGAGAGR